MSRIRGKDTTPEKVVRLLLHRLGYRFRLHVRIPITAKDAEYAKPVGHKRTQSSQRFPPGGASVLASRSPWRVEVKRRRLNSLARRSDPPRRNVVKTGAKTAPPSTPRFVTPDIVLTKAPRRGLRPRLFLASASRLQKLHHAHASARMVAGKTQRQRCPRQAASTRLTQTRLASDCDLGMSDRKAKDTGTSPPEALEIDWLTIKRKPNRLPAACLF